MNHIRRAFALLAALMAIGSMAVITSAPAQAATSCSGTISYSKSYPTSNSVGELTIYYNSSNGGTNSACFYHRGAAYGVAAPTYVRIYRCTEQSGEGQPCTIAASSSPDSGSYGYYAGPVGVTGTANHCVAAEGYIVWGGSEYYISSGRQGC